MAAITHHFFPNTALPYITNANVVETQPHWVGNSHDAMSSLRGFMQKRPGTVPFTSDTFSDPIARIFQWRLWASNFIIMVNTVGSGVSIVYKLEIGVDVTFQSIFTSTTEAPFDFVLSNNQVYFANGVDMMKYDGATVSLWGIAKPGSAPLATQGGGPLTSVAGGWSYVYAFGNGTTTGIGAISDASPYTGNNASVQYTITGSSTTDPQVTLVHIYRTLDGGAIYYELPNSPISYSPGWAVIDTALDTDLNIVNQASPPGMNSPPPPSKGPIFFAGRIWTFTGDKLFYSTFEENVNGVNDENFYTINEYHMGQEITGLGVCQRALMVFMRNNIQRIIGDSLTTFSRQPFVNRMGVVSSTNIAAGSARMLAWLDTTGTVYVSDGLGVQELGLPIRNDLYTIDQTVSSIVFHADGERQWLVVQDPSLNQMWVYDADNGQWMPPWFIAGTAICSADIAGVYILLLTPNLGTSVIKFVPTVFLDSEAAYPALLISSLMDVGQGTGPGDVGTTSYVAIERNSVALNDVLLVTDEDPLNGGARVSIFANEIDPPDRVQGSDLVEKWYPQRASVPSSRRVSVGLSWPQTGDQWKLYSLDIVTNQMEADTGAG